MTEEPFKTSEKPSRPFIYVSQRPYMAEKPRRSLFPEALTEAKGDRIVEHLGEVFDLRFDTSPRVVLEGAHEGMYSHFVSGKATLEDFAKIPFLGKGYGEMYEVFDWVYRFHLKPEDISFLATLMDRKDKYLGGEHAFEKASAHWGTERWGCLTLDLSLDGDRLYRTDIDVFASAGRPELLVVGAHSHKPDLLKKFRKED
ncbi:hypothetical protein KY310_04600 [Candidatus Woesearchaeota archaeon]|nr:hypothetical protein [Candidatus Woesearchaeota archaeon]